MNARPLFRRRHESRLAYFARRAWVALAPWVGGAIGGFVLMYLLAGAL